LVEISWVWQKNHRQQKQKYVSGTTSNSKVSEQQMKQQVEKAALKWRKIFAIHISQKCHLGKNYLV
jgi:hypothetical protein